MAGLIGVAQRGGRRTSVMRATELAVCYFVLGFVSFATILPIVAMLFGALKSNSAIVTTPASLPIPPQISGFRQLIALGQLRNFVNSIVIGAVTTIGGVLVSGLAGYAFTKLRFPGRRAAFIILLATIMVPIQTAIPGFYTQFTKFGWLNTYQVQIVPFLTPVFGLFLVRQYLIGMPDSIIEAARLDGAGEWRIYWRIVFPLLRPALGALSVLLFLFSWNNYLWPSIFAADSSVSPFAVSLTTLRDPSLGVTQLYAPTLAGCLIATVPMVLVFLRFQRTFMASAVFSAE